MIKFSCRIILVSLTLFWAKAVYPQPALEICEIFGYPRENQSTSQFSILSSLRLGINILTPVQDAKARIENGDYRVLVYEIEKLRIPGLGAIDKDNHNLKIICDRLGFRYIEGLSPVKYDPDVRKLSNDLIKYMERYNQHVLSTVNCK